MKNTDHRSHSTSVLRKLFAFVFETSFLGFVALGLTFYAYGELQSWSFLKLNSDSASLTWNKDFVSQLSRCEQLPSTLEQCKKALFEVESWLELDQPESVMDVTSVASLQDRARNVGESISLAYEEEAALLGLRAWVRQIDPYASLSLERLKENKTHSPSWFIQSQGNAVHLRIKSFDSEDLCTDLAGVLNRFESDISVEKMVLDLRDNPGGHVESALCITDLFVAKGELLAEFSKSRSMLPFELKERDSIGEWLRQKLNIRRFSRRARYDQLFTKPLEVWINKNSASAAELVTASLKDLNRAQILGERSYGKNTVQISKAIAGLDGVKAFVTAYEWYRPLGGSIRATRGIVPDKVLEF